MKRNFKHDENLGCAMKKDDFERIKDVCEKRNGGMLKVMKDCIKLAILVK